MPEEDLFKVCLADWVNEQHPRVGMLDWVLSDRELGCLLRVLPPVLWHAQHV